MVDDQRDVRGALQEVAREPEFHPDLKDVRRRVERRGRRHRLEAALGGVGLGILAVAVVVLTLGPLRSTDRDGRQADEFAPGTVTTQPGEGAPEGTMLLRTDSGAEILRGGAGQSELVAGGAGALDLSADGSRVLASIGQEFVVIDLSTGERSVLVRATGEDVLGAFALWSPDGSKVAYSLGAPDPQERSVICVVTVASKTTECFPEAGRVFEFDWSPDARRLVAAGPPEQPVRIVDVATGQVADVVPQEGDSPINAALREAGMAEAIQLVAPRWSSSGVYLAAKASLDVARGVAYVPVVFTPDGRLVALGRRSEQGFEAFGWSPVADQLAYGLGREYRITEVYVLDVAAGTDTPLVTRPERDAPVISGLAWSPTGRWVALTAWEDEGAGRFPAILRIIDAATGDSWELDVNTSEELDVIGWGP
jgi:dipeptidyl aminopeptidase/acylaminoacyl peptidase